MNPLSKSHSLVTASALATGIALFAASGSASAAAWSSTATRATDIQGMTAVSRAPASMPIRLAIGLSLQNKSAFDSFFQHLTTFGDPAFGKTISNASFVAQYSPTQKQTQSVVDFLSKAGFSNIEVAGNRLMITATGTSALAEKAFNTQISQYRVNDELVYANTRDAKVPSAFGGLITYVGGLQNLYRARTLHTAGRPTTAPTGDAKTTTYSYYPTTIARLYNVAGTEAALTQSAAIVAEGDMDQTLIDFQSFLAATPAIPAMPAPKVIYTEPKGTDTSGTVEWDIDSQSIVGMGGGLGQLYFYASAALYNSDLAVTYNAIVSDDLAPSANVSLGECESGTNGDGSMAIYDQTFQVGIAQGQTFFVASGDHGADQCGRHYNSIGVSSPASSPYVVAVGGTSLYINTADGSYDSETAWSGSGGGVSVYEPRPDWQASVNSGAFRTVPDIAADADPDTGEFIYENGTTATYGGTSLAAPLSAGASLRLWAHFGSPTYFMAPLIYAYVPAFQAGAHDITSGSNGAYSAGVGYDLVTGFGSWNVYCDIYDCN